MKRVLYLCNMVIMVLFMFPLTTTGVTIEVLTPGTLEQVIDDSDELTFKDMKIIGQLNATDISYLRSGTGRIATVENLDLSEVTIVSGGEAYAKVSYSDNSNTMDNYVITFYASEENRKETTVESNMLGGNNFSIKYYSNQLAGAFANKSYKTVVMPKNVKEIGPMTFFQCKELTNVGYTNPIEVIEDRAFESCVNLKDIDLSKLKTLGQGAFAGCKSLRGNADETLNLSSLETIPDNAFGGASEDYCISFKHIVFSTQLKHIGAQAFYFCESLEEVVLPEGLEDIGIYAFYGCSSLATVNIPSSVQNFDYDMFGNTPWLSTLPAEDGVVYLNNIAVQCIKNDGTDYGITIREGTESIAPNFMSNDSKEYLTSVVLPQTIKRIGGGAFNGCSNLSSINFPEGLESIEDESPHQWGRDVYTTNEGAFGGTGLTSVILPSTLKSIGQHTFYYCSSLESITLPEGLEEIGSEAFSNCTKLTSVAFPESIKKIGWGAFSGCTSLAGSVTIPQGVTELGSGIFDKTNLFSIIYLAQKANSESSNQGIFSAERVTIGANVQSLPNGFFSFSEMLKKVTFEERAEDAELVLGDYCFDYCGKLTSIDLPKTTKIGKGCFQGSALTSIIFKDGLTEVGEGAFYFTPLTTVDLGNTVTRIEGSAFKECKELISITWGNNLKYLGDNTFELCKKLERVTLPEGLEYLGWRCFEESGITRIHVPGSVRVIESFTFQSCTNLVEVELGEGIETIGDHAFAFCSLLESIILPEGLKTLEDSSTGGGYIFRDCTSLKQVSLPSTLQDLGTWNFPSTLETIISYMEEPVDIVESAFNYWNYKNARLIVPTGAKAAYLSKDYWKDFENIEEMPSSTDMLTVKHTTIEQGQTASVDITLQNEVTDYTAYQFDLVLPEGFVIAKNEKGRYDVTLAERNEGHGLTVENIVDNRYRFICISLSNEPITGTNGLLLQMALQAHSSLTDGDYSGRVENIIITRSNGDKYTLKSNDFTLTVGEVTVTPGDVNGDVEVDVADVVYIVNGILGKPAADYNEEAADVNGDGVVDVADVVEAVNIILKKDK